MLRGGIQMLGSDSLETLYVVSAFVLQAILIVHFTFRKWRFETAIRYGFIVYGLSIPFAVGSLLLLLGGKTWLFWLGGLIYLLWAILGYVTEYILKVEWRLPIRWSIFGPYLFLYFGMLMFYWWPLARINKILWYLYAVLFLISTFLNVTSHKRPTEAVKPEGPEKVPGR